MKNIIIFSGMLTLMVSCGGSKSGGAGADSETNPVRTEKLSEAEASLVTKLIEIGVLKQKELQKELVEHRMVSTKVLHKLDQFINVQCIHSRGLCYVTQKD